MPDCHRKGSTAPCTAHRRERHARAELAHYPPEVASGEEAEAREGAVQAEPVPARVVEDLRTQVERHVHAARRLVAAPQAELAPNTRLDYRRIDFGTNH